VTTSAGLIAGNATLSAYDQLAIAGEIDLSLPNQPAAATRRGGLSLATSTAGGRRIRVGDEKTDVLDVAKVQYAAFNSGGTYTQVSGVLTNFSTNSIGGRGLIKDPYVTTQTALRCPANNKIYYNYESGLNDYLGGYAYRVADVAGNAGQGGLLLVTKSDTRGTVVIFK